jgi:hypothetical protein
MPTEVEVKPMLLPARLLLPAIAVTVESKSSSPSLALVPLPPLATTRNAATSSISRKDCKRANTGDKNRLGSDGTSCAKHDSNPKRAARK